MSKKLSEKQKYAIELLTQFPQTLTYEQMAEKIGVSPSTFREWRNNNDTFADELTRQVKRQALADLPRVMASVPDIIIEDKNAAMLRTWLQAVGALTDKVEVTTNNNNTTDVDVIRAEIERLRNGK